MLTFKKLKFERHSSDFGWISHTKIGDKILSICAGDMFYSTPRHDLYDLSRYKRFEVSVLNEDNLVITKEVFPEYRADILPYVEIEEINDLIRRLDE